MSRNKYGAKYIAKKHCVKAYFMRTGHQAQTQDSPPTAQLPCFATSPFGRFMAHRAPCQN